MNKEEREYDFVFNKLGLALWDVFFIRGVDILSLPIYAGLYSMSAFFEHEKS